MTSVVESGIARAGLFFAGTFLLATLLGALLGDHRLGMRTGVILGLLLAVFGYAFVRPT